MALPFATRTRYCPVRGNTRFLAPLLPRPGAIRGTLLGRLRWRCHSQPERAIAPRGGNTRFWLRYCPGWGNTLRCAAILPRPGRNTPRFLHATRHGRLPAGVVSVRVVSVRHIGTHRAVVMRSSSLSARSLYSSHRAAICVIIRVPHRLSFIAQKEVP